MTASAAAMRAATLDASGFGIRRWPERVRGRARRWWRSAYVGVCGSDVRLVLDGTVRSARLPIVLGHEPAGRFAALGDGTPGPAIGTPVAIVTLVTCTECERCTAGRSVACPERRCLASTRTGAGPTSWRCRCTT